MTKCKTSDVSFLKFLIKKSSCFFFFYKGWSVFFCHAGVPIYNWKKLQLEKKSKN